MTSDPDRIIGLYQRHAAAFDRDRARSLSEKPWLDRFVAALPGKTILDLGCGHGEPIGRYLIGQGLRLLGVDSSPPLIALCCRRFPDQEWMVEDMRRLALNVPFAGILAWQSFFHLTHDDQRAMFPVFQAHTGPGSALMFTTGTRFGEAIGSYEGEPLYHASLDRDAYRALLTVHDFEVLEEFVGDHDHKGSIVWLARRVPGAGGLNRPERVPPNRDS